MLRRGKCKSRSIDVPAEVLLAQLDVDETFLKRRGLGGVDTEIWVLGREYVPVDAVN